MGVLRIGIVLAVVVAAAIAANVALLSLASGRGEPVGRLSPVVAIQPGPRVTPPRPAPAPSATRPSGEADD